MTAITITDAAHDYLADLLSKQNTPGIGIRVFITQPGTQYAETCIAYCKPGEEKPEDTALGLKSFTAYIDHFSEAFLDDAVVDYATDRMGGQLTIKAPNAKVPMVNADSPVNERINYYLQTEINPGVGQPRRPGQPDRRGRRRHRRAAIRWRLPGLWPGRRDLEGRHRAHLARAYSRAQGCA